MNTPNLQYKINAGMGNKWRRFHIWSRFIDTATSAAENEAAQITHKLLGLEQFWFQKWNWQAKNNPKSQISSFYDNHYDIYGRSSISYITQWGQTNRPLVSWNYLDGNLGISTETFCCTTYYGQTQLNFIALYAKMQDIQIYKIF